MSFKKSINKHKTSNVSGSIDTLYNIRKKIDKIDNKIHDLIMERAEIVEQVVGEKKKENKQSLVIYRPAREHEILVRLLKRHRGNLGEKALINIWRNLISAYIEMQGGLTLSYCGNIDRIVNKHFGLGIKKTKTKTVLDALKSVNENKSQITVLPFPNKDNDWWVKFSNFEGINVIGSISDSDHGIPQTLILGKQNIEYFNYNIVLYILEIESKNVKAYSKLLFLNDYIIVAVKIIGNNKAIIIFSTKVSSCEEAEDKIKSIKNTQFNINTPPKIMGVFAIFDEGVLNG